MELVYNTPPLLGYHHLTFSINEYLNKEGFEGIFTAGEKCPLLLFITLSIVFSALAAMFLFPNFQYASLFLDSLESSSPVKKIALYATFFLPLISFLTFVKPVKAYTMASTKMTDDFFETFRILIIILWAAMRCVTAKFHLQTFLDMPKAKIIEFTQDSQMKEEERQRKVAHYASYSCVSLLQYFVPVLITLAMALLLKSLGDIKLGSLMNMENSLHSDQQNSGKDYGALQPFLDKGIQKAFWTLLTTFCVGINSVLSVCGVIFKRTLLSKQ